MTCLADALVMEAVEVLKLTKDLEQAKGILWAGMQRHNFVYYEQIATIDRFKREVKSVPYMKQHSDSLGRAPVWL